MRGTRAALAALGCGALIGIPALARAQQQDPLTGEVTAQDVGRTHRFSVNGTDSSTLTVATGATVTFDYPSGTSVHNVDFDAAQPTSCVQTAGPNAGPVPPLPARFMGPGWAGTCTFAVAGTYTFHCDVHLNMTGTIVVHDQPAATSTSTPAPTPPPGATPTPTPTATPVAVPLQPTLTVKLAGHQKGARVRGSVQVQAARSRLEVVLWVPRSRLSGGHGRKLVRVGRSVTTATMAGGNAFSVRLTAKARAALRRRHRLGVTVTVALTPPGGAQITRSLHTTLRR
jgi:plastocyanin